VVKMYQNILKWDAYELYIKCRKFRTTILQSNTKENDRQSNNSNSDILKVFPKSLLVMLA
jgi:methyltransferase-like protein